MTNPSSTPPRSSTSPIQGLTTAEASRRLTEYGFNTVETIQPERWLRLLLRQFNSIIVWVLALLICGVFC